VLRDILQLRAQEISAPENACGRWQQEVPASRDPSPEDIGLVLFPYLRAGRSSFAHEQDAFCAAMYTNFWTAKLFRIISAAK